MKILLAIARTDYGKPGAGDSYEYSSWFQPLGELRHDVEVFDTFDPSWIGDPEATGRALLDHVAAMRPDLVLTMMIEHEIPVGVIDRLRRQGPIANWFADDRWRFWAYSRHMAPHFTFVITTSRRAKDRYDEMSDVRAYFRPWGYNPSIFHPEPASLRYDVGFVGQRYGSRGRIVERLRARGIEVAARGSGWSGGWIEPNDLARQFASTKINLNFLESSAGPFQRLGIHVRGSWRADRMITRFIAPPTQLKARPFEITACGGFVLTNTAPELSEFFVVGEELAIFRSEAELVRQIERYLDHEEERARVAEAGLRRAASYSWHAVLRSLLDEAMASDL